MSRGNAAANTAASQLRQIRPITFLEFRADGGTIYLHTGAGKIVWGLDQSSPAQPITWTGAGALLGIGPIEDGDKTGPIRVSFTLAALNDELLSLALTENVYRRLAIVYAGYLDQQGNLVADPDERWRGYGDGIEISYGETDVLVLHCEDEHIRDLRPNGLLFTNEDQQDLYSGDTGFQFLDQLVDARVQWGPTAAQVAAGVYDAPGWQPPPDREW